MKKIISLFVLLAVVFNSAPMFGQQKVKASFYANKFHGRKTASGELYHKDSLTCAHKTFPFGTMLKVRNPKNNKEVIVTVTDRGPFVKGRTLDLSLAAAKKIGLVHKGIATVEFTQLDKMPENKAEEGINIPILEIIDLKIQTDSMIFVTDNTTVANDSIKLSAWINQLNIKKTNKDKPLVSQ